MFSHVLNFVSVNSDEAIWIDINAYLLLVESYTQVHIHIHTQTQAHTHTHNGQGTGEGGKEERESEIDRRDEGERRRCHIILNRYTGMKNLRARHANAWSSLFSGLWKWEFKRHRGTRI